MIISIKSFTEEEGAKHAEIINRCVGWGLAAVFTLAYMKIRHGVFFEGDHTTNLFIAYADSYKSDDLEWSYTSKGLAMQEWLNENIPGRYSIQASYVFFEDYDDALLCYLRFKG